MSPEEKNQIRSLLQDRRWQAIENAANDFSQRIALSPKLRDSQWETLKSTLVDEGRIIGIKDFFQELMKIIND
jgi:hypothetical protein